MPQVRQGRSRRNSIRNSTEERPRRTSVVVGDSELDSADAVVRRSSRLLQDSESLYEPRSTLPRPYSASPSRSMDIPNRSDKDAPVDLPVAPVQEEQGWGSESTTSVALSGRIHIQQAQTMAEMKLRSRASSRANSHTTTPAPSVPASPARVGATAASPLRRSTLLDEACAVDAPSAVAPSPHKDSQQVLVKQAEPAATKAPVWKAPSSNKASSSSSTKVTCREPKPQTAATTRPSSASARPSAAATAASKRPASARQPATTTTTASVSKATNAVAKHPPTKPTAAAAAAVPGSPPPASGSTKAARPSSTVSTRPSTASPSKKKPTAVACGKTPVSPPRPSTAPEGSSSSSSSSARRATAEKREWLAAANKLRLAQRQLEAALGATVELGALTEAERLALEAEQEGLVEAMGEYLDGIRTTVTRLTAHVSQPYQGAEFIGTLTRLMDQGESSISELKAAQRTQFDGLLSSENELDKELQLFVERAKGWENSTTASSTAAVAAPVVRRPKTAGGVPGMRPARPLKEVWDGLVPDEVTAYDSFVERTGATGSWDAPDHAYFKKTLARCGHDYARTTEVLATEMAAVFSRGEVIAHARWDAEHEDLLIRKRMAIQRWRAEKEKRQAEQLQAGLQAVAATSAAAAPRKVTAAEASEEREEQRRALEAWRAERKAKADELERARVEQEEAAAEERRRVRAAKLKEQRQRQAAEEAAARQREAAVAEAVAGQNRPRSAPQFRSRPTAAELAKLKAMHERDLLLAARRTAAVGACKQKTSAKARRLEELRVQRKPSAPAAPRDPARLLRPTAAVAARLLAEDGPGQLFAERPVHVPRMVPSWMSN